MNRLIIGTSNMLILGFVLVLIFGCSSGGGNPVTPETGSDSTTENAPSDIEKQARSGSFGILGTGVLILNEEDLTIEVI
ncbi:hypothetical protein KAU08_08000, partial [bacterium]|nr:hypothetical protein [bacterium]